MTGEELFDRFAAHIVTPQEVAAMDLAIVTDQISEFRLIDPDDIPMSNAEIAQAILEYAKAA